MGKFGLQRDHQHRERVATKHNDLELLKALRDTHLMKLPEYHPTVTRLNRRIKKLENQLRNMRP